MRTANPLLLGSFFTVATQASEPNRLQLQVQINAHHALFKGHFPGRPVVPGVCVLAMIKDVLQQHLAKDLLLRTCTSSKFLRPIDPLLMPNLDLRIDYTRREFLLDFVASVQHQQQVLCRVAGCFQTDFL
jgi:3-hydroxyacyl-[acyl-carrier-protein] dehydratase